MSGYIENAEERYEAVLRNILRPAALEEDPRVVQETRWAFLSGEIFRKAGLELYRSWKPRVFAVYFEALDVVGHRFTTADSVEQEKIYDTFGNVHEKYYLFMDEMQQELSVHRGTRSTLSQLFLDDPVNNFVLQPLQAGAQVHRKGVWIAESPVPLPETAEL